MYLPRIVQILTDMCHIVSQLLCITIKYFCIINT
nr:MAG TPA: hypothetical protein [Caudoviricetes sp.]